MKPITRPLFVFLFVLPCLVHAQSMEWYGKVNFPGPGRQGAAAFSIGSKGYVGTGYNLTTGQLKDFWEYDPSTNVWTQKADFGGTARSNAIGFSLGNKGYIGTGNSSLSDFWEYNPVTNVWVQKANVGGGGRGGAVCFTIGNKGYVGLGTSSSTLKYDLWEYNQTTNAWSQKTPFPGTGRYGAVGFSIGNIGYIATGTNSTTMPVSYLNDMWAYNQTTNLWSQKSSFMGYDGFGAVGFAIGNKGYVGKGFFSSSLQEYDPVNNWWVPVGASMEFNNSTGFVIGQRGYCLINGAPYFAEFGPNLYINKLQKNAVCAGDSLWIYFDSRIPSTPISFQLSDPTGSFDTYTVLATRTYSGIADSIKVKMPTTTGSAYRIRIQSTPEDTFSLNFSENIIIDDVNATLSTNKTIFCPGDKAILTGNSGSGYTYKWFKNDTLLSTSSTPTYNATVAGTYKTVITTTVGCSDTSGDMVLSQYIKPKVGFSLNNTAQCINQNRFELTDTSTISSGTLTRLWRLGDGTTDTSLLSVKTYSTPSTYSVKLISISNNGCADSVSKNVTVYPKPNVAAVINNTNQCINSNNFIFTGTSTISGGTLTHSWNLGDSTFATTSVVAKTYNQSGTYAVKLVSTSNFGCKDSITQPVTVNPKPLVGFTINTPVQCENGNNFILNDTSSINSGTVSQLWKLGDNSTASTPVVAKVYNQAGTYAVKLVSISNFGCKDSITQPVTVNPKPNMGFTINTPVQCENTNNFILADTSSISSGTLSVLWNLGDNSVATTSAVTKTYSQAGTYAVKLVSNSDFGCKDSIIQLVTVNPKPNVGFMINTPVQCENGNSFMLSDTSVISSGTVMQQWNLGDNSLASTPSVTHAYNQAGSYSVKLVSTSNFGCKDSTTQSVTVNPKPSVGFTINTPVQCENGNSFMLNDTSSIASGTVSPYWNLGDDSTALTPAVTKAYNQAGSYSVKLVSTSNFGCKDSITQSVTVNPKPGVGFTINTPVQCENGNSFMLNDTSSITSGTVSPYWNLGDDSVATTFAVTKSYNQAGTYFIKLVSNSNFGCKDSITQSLTVNPKPNVGFTINTPAQCENDNLFVFTDTSSVTAGTVSQHWNLGDNSVGNTPVVAKTYNQAGTYLIKLVSTSNSGCKDSIIQQVTLYPKTNASITTQSPLHFCSGSNIILNAYAGVDHHYKWIENGSILSGQTDSSVTIDRSGLYRAIVTNQFGCNDTSSAVQTVANPLPATSAISGDTLVYQTSTKVYSVLVTNGSQYNWVIEHGEQDSVINNTIAIQWNTVGRSKVKVVETTDSGCVGDTVVLNVTVLAIPDSLNLSHDTLYFSADSGSLVLTLESNTIWNTAASEPGWVTIAPASGTGNNTLTVSVTKNPQPNTRISSILFSTPTIAKSIIVVQDFSTGVTEPTLLNDIKVFPNPTQGSFVISNTSNMELYYTVLNVNGQEVMSAHKIPSNTEQPCMLSVEPGVYFIKLETSGKMRYVKLVLTK